MILQVAKRIANIRFDAELKKNFLTKSSIKKFQVYIFQKPGFAIVPWQQVCYTDNDRTVLCTLGIFLCLIL